MTDKVQRIWRGHSWAFHLATLCISLGVTYGIVTTNVEAQAGEIATLRAKNDAIIESISQIKTDTAVTKSQVSDIKESVGEIKQALNIAKHR